MKSLKRMASKVHLKLPLSLGPLSAAGRRAGPESPLPAPGTDGPIPRSVVPLAGPPSAEARELSQRLVAVQESVRRDMADYLHGHVQSKLVALSISLGTCQKLLSRDPAGASQLLERVREELQRVQDEDLRQVSWQLYPAIIKMGLVPAMRSLVDRFSEVLDIDLVIDADVFALEAAGEAGIPEKQRLGIYRIAEEALNNVLKYAGSRRVEVTLVYDAEHRVSLSVIDDGCGFDPVELTALHGLVMMRDYAEAMGGQAEVSTALGRGTTVRLVIPVKPSWQPAELSGAGLGRAPSF